MVEARGIGKGGRATAAEEMDSTDSGGNLAASVLASLMLPRWSDW